MAKQLTNPITSHYVIWMDNEFGWIRLVNGGNDAGYVYLLPDSDPLLTPHLSLAAEYIVMSIHQSRLGDFLYVLNNEDPLQIRFFDPEAPGVKPSAFIEPANVPITPQNENPVELFNNLRQ